MADAYTEYAETIRSLPLYADDFEPLRVTAAKLRPQVSGPVVPSIVSRAFYFAGPPLANATGWRTFCIRPWQGRWVLYGTGLCDDRCYLEAPGAQSYARANWPERLLQLDDSLILYYSRGSDKAAASTVCRRTLQALAEYYSPAAAMSAATGAWVTCALARAEFVYTLMREYCEKCGRTYTAVVPASHVCGALDDGGECLPPGAFLALVEAGHMFQSSPWQDYARETTAWYLDKVPTRLPPITQYHRPGRRIDLGDS